MRNPLVLVGLVSAGLVSVGAGAWLFSTKRKPGFKDFGNFFPSNLYKNSADRSKKAFFESAIAVRSAL